MKHLSLNTRTENATADFVMFFLNGLDAVLFPATGFVVLLNDLCEECDIDPTPHSYLTASFTTVEGDDLTTAEENLYNESLHDALNEIFETWR